MKVRNSYIETYLLKKRSEGLGCGLDVMEGGCVLNGRKFSS